MTREIAFTKGHGTENDFVLVPDLDGARELTPETVAALADRRAGIGGDGVIRIVPAASAIEAEVRDQARSARWFMDYRNADGSVAEMCGNGTRVFAAYLRREGLETADEFAIATRAGVKTVRVEGEEFAVDLGPWRLTDPMAAERDGFDALVHVDDGDPFSALSVDLGNPHTVLALPETVDLAAIDLTRAPVVRPTPARGTNVELVRPLGPDHIAMRVHERGVGETRSCGTGAAAAAIATSFWAGQHLATPTWTVDVPGGRLRVRLLPGQHVELAGPAALVADGTVTLPCAKHRAGEEFTIARNGKPVAVLSSPPRGGVVFGTMKSGTPGFDLEHAEALVAAQASTRHTEVGLDPPGEGVRSEIALHHEVCRAARSQPRQPGPQQVVQGGLADPDRGIGPDQVEAQVRVHFRGE